MKPTPIPIALVRHPSCWLHDPGADHPETAARLTAILDAVRADPELARRGLVELEALPAEPEQLALAHTAAHVAFVRERADEARRRGRPVWLDSETAISGDSFLAASAAAGCAVTAAELVATGRARTAFALARPPGHHAAAARGWGYCLFNNAAIAARRVQALGLARRVLVVDWDVHHGDGTQAIAWEDPTVYLLSLHLFPHWPDTGAASERGEGAGAGATRNVPLPPGTDRAEYRRRFSEALAASLGEFAPDLVLVSAGFDCLAGDPQGGLPLEPEDLHAMTQELVERTRPSARGRVAVVLEGGYVPGRVALGAVDVLRALGGLPAASRPARPRHAATP